MTEFVTLDRDGPVATMTLNRPEERNALSDRESCAALAEACAALNDDPAVSVVILTGAGPAFCAGGNLKRMRARSGVGAAATPVATRLNYKRTVQLIPRALYDIEVPTIAAVNGPAIGAGLDLACMCDIRIASDRASFAESFVRLGIVPGDGGAWFLQRAVGLSKACEMSFTGDALDPQAALACGLVSQVVPAHELMTAARALAARIAANPRHALHLTKRLIREAQRLPLDALLEMSAAFQALAHETDDHREALDAWAEKRPPRFTGS